MLADFRSRAVDLGYAAGWSAVKALPGPLARGSFRAAADYAAVRNGRGARQLRANLRRVLGPDASELRLDRLVGESLRSYSRYWLETFRLPAMDHADVLSRAFVLHFDRVEQALERGRGVVAALPHMANWDIAALWLVEHGHPFTTVVERLQPESLFDRFVAYRQSIGMEVVALTGGERSATEILTERLRQNRVVCLVADRDLSHRGVEVSFFGEPAKFPPGPALLAATTGAALFPVGLWFTEDGWGHRVGPEIPLVGDRLRDRVHNATQALADAFAHEIAEHPADWHMLQKLWLADLNPTRSLRDSAGTPNKLDPR